MPTHIQGRCWTSHSKHIARRQEKGNTACVRRTTPHGARPNQPLSALKLHYSKFKPMYFLLQNNNARPAIVPRNATHVCLQKTQHRTPHCAQPIQLLSALTLHYKNVQTNVLVPFKTTMLDQQLYQKRQDAVLHAKDDLTST